MDSIKKLFKWGLYLTIIPPLISTIPTVIGMITTFNYISVQQDVEKTEEALSQYVSVGFNTTLIGLNISAIGIVLLIICLFRYIAYNKKQNKNTA